MNISHFGLARQYALLKDELLDASHQALKSGQLINGEFTKTFEEWLKMKTRTTYAITVHSGTQALEIIARWYGKSPASTGTIQLPNLTYPATLNAFLTAGWKVELCDTNNHGIFVPDEIGGFPACVVGLYGKRPSNLRFGQDLIVDGAQHWLIANGAVGKGMAISFDPTKNLPSSGNGGAIVTNELGLYNFALAYRSNDMEEHLGPGTNSKMSEQDCAQILVRTKYIDAWQCRRQEIANYWIDSFKELPVRCLCEKTDTTSSVAFPPTEHAYQKFVIDVGGNRNSLYTNLLLDGIETKIHYGYTLGELPVAKHLQIDKPDMMSVSIMLSRGVLSLPMYPELTDLETEYIADQVCKFYDK